MGRSPGSMLAEPAGERLPQIIVRALHGIRPERRARQLATGILRGVGVSCDLDDVELAVSELAANAHQHAAGPYELRIFIRADDVKIAVLDRGDDHAALSRRLLSAATVLAPDAESGRGLRIVTALFPGAWGIEPTTTCLGDRPAKQVWISVPRRSTAGASAPGQPGC